MPGLAGRDQGCTGFRDNPDRRIADPLKNLAVALPLDGVPACRAADIKAAVLILNQISGLIQFSQDSGGKGLYILLRVRIAEEPALETDSPHSRVRAVAGALPDQKTASRRSGISCDKTGRVAHGHNGRLAFFFPGKSGHRALRVTQIKSKKTFHLFFLLEKCRTAAAYTEAIPFLSTVPSMVRAGRIVSVCPPGRSSNQPACSGL